MNTRQNVTDNTLTDGIETSFGTIYAVEEGDAYFPGVSLYLKRSSGDYAELLLSVEDNQKKNLRALLYPKFFDFDASPDVINFDFEKPKEE